MALVEVHEAEERPLVELVDPTEHSLALLCGAIVATRTNGVQHPLDPRPQPLQVQAAVTVVGHELEEVEARVETALGRDPDVRARALRDIARAAQHRRQQAVLQGGDRVVAAHHRLARRLGEPHRTWKDPRQERRVRRHRPPTGRMCVRRHHPATGQVGGDRARAGRRAEGLQRVAPARVPDDQQDVWCAHGTTPSTNGTSKTFSWEIGP